MLPLPLWLPPLPLWLPLPVSHRWDAGTDCSMTSLMFDKGTVGGLAAVPVATMAMARPRGMTSNPIFIPLLLSLMRKLRRTVVRQTLPQRRSFGGVGEDIRERAKSELFKRYA